MLDYVGAVTTEEECSTTRHVLCMCVCVRFMCFVCVCVCVADTQVDVWLRPQRLHPPAAARAGRRCREVWQRGSIHQRLQVCKFCAVLCCVRVVVYALCCVVFCVVYALCCVVLCVVLCCVVCCVVLCCACMCVHA